MNAFSTNDVNSFFPTRLAGMSIWESVEESQCAAVLDSASDETLITYLQLGRQEALGHLFRRYSGVIRTISARILRNSAEAEDLVQDLFLFIQRKCAVFDSSKSSARSWIIQMAYYQALERRRYLAARLMSSCDEVPNLNRQVVGIPTTEHDYSPEVVFGRNGLSEVLESLSADQRTTLVLYFFEGYTLAEISQELRQNLGNVRNHYYRALDKLRKHMFRRKFPLAQGNGR